jgi:hypothetical protein
VGDDGHELERVGRPRRPALWIGAWVVGLVAVVGLAVVGRGTPVGDLAAGPVVQPAASPAPAAPVPPPAASATPRLPDDLPRIIRPRPAAVPGTPRPVPTLGDDGLVGGTAYSSAAPAGVPRVVPGP